MRSFVNLAGAIALSNVTELRRPYKLTFALTYRCQLRCSMCGIWRKGAAPELTVDEIDAIFRNAGGLSWVHLSGGEIFLRRDLLEIIRSLHRHCRTVHLLNFPTNGFATEVIVPTVAEILKKYPFPRTVTTVSIDGPPSVHDRIRGVDGAWERAVETYRELRKMRSGRFQVLLGMTLQDANAYLIEETAETVRDRIGGVGVDELHFNILHTSEHYYGNTDASATSRKEQMQRTLGDICRRRTASPLRPENILERRYQVLADRYLRTGRSPVACQALSASVFLDPAGDAYPCTIFNAKIGNVAEYGYSLDRLWNTDRRRSLRQAIRRADCPQCWTPCEAYQSILGGLLRRGKAGT